MLVCSTVLWVPGRGTRDHALWHRGGGHRHLTPASSIQTPMSRHTTVRAGEQHCDAIAARAARVQWHTQRTPTTTPTGKRQ